MYSGLLYGYTSSLSTFKCGSGVCPEMVCLYLPKIGNVLQTDPILHPITFSTPIWEFSMKQYTLAVNEWRVSTCVVYTWQRACFRLEILWSFFLEVLILTDSKLVCNLDCMPKCVVLSNEVVSLLATMDQALSTSAAGRDLWICLLRSCVVCSIAERIGLEYIMESSVATVSFRIEACTFSLLIRWQEMLCGKSSLN